MCASYVGCDELPAIIFFTISISAHGFNSGLFDFFFCLHFCELSLKKIAVGAAINLFDLAPNYAAPLDAVINSLATFVGLLTPYIAGILTPNVREFFRILF